MNTHFDFDRDILMPLRDHATDRLDMAEKLAGIITLLLNEHERLLKAVRDGTEITVSEKGGPLVFSINVEPESQGSGSAPNKPLPSDQ